MIDIGGLDCYKDKVRYIFVQAISDNSMDAARDSRLLGSDRPIRGLLDQVSLGSQ